MAEENRDKPKDPEYMPPAFKLLVDFARERGIIGEKDAKSQNECHEVNIKRKIVGKNKH